jgi:uncharacterized membrane protein
VREILLFIHIVAVGAWVGANVTQLIVNPAMQKTGGNPAAVWMRQTARMGRVLYTPAAIVALITGVWLVIDSRLYEFEHVFVAIGFLMVIVGGVLGMRVFGPGGRQAASLHEAGDEEGAVAVNVRLRNWVLVDSALLALTIYVMVAKVGA